jgi:arsenate reductase-like glutaredoxin family protein
MHLPAVHEYPKATYFVEYLQFEENSNLFDIFKKQTNDVNTTFNSLTDTKANESYLAGKWTLKEVLGHMVDTERIFSYRLLCISRQEKQVLPGFDENEYQMNSGYGTQDIEAVLKQYHSTRMSTIDLLNFLSTSQWDQKGIVNGNEVSVRALAWMIAGHEKHHIQVIKERYLIQNP